MPSLPKYLSQLFVIFPLFLHASLNQSNNLQLIPTHNSVTLTWEDTSNSETGFKIFRNGILIAVTDSDVEHFIDTNLDPNTFYRYSVKATNEVGDVPKKKIVFGYYHFHQMNATTDNETNWDNFTHVAWHFVELTGDIPAHLFVYNFSDGTPTWPTAEEGKGLNDPALKGVKNRLDMLHSKGIKVYLGVMASHDITKEILGNQAWRSTAIDAIINAMILGGADGLDIDIENQAVSLVESDVQGSQERIENLYQFIKELRIELDSRELYDKAINIATPVRFGYLNAYENSPVKKILNIVDSFFVMGYDIKWTTKASSHSLFRWSDAYEEGADRGMSDYGWSIMRGISGLTHDIDPNLRSKIILGVPYYSYQYLTDSPFLAAQKVQGFIYPGTNSVGNPYGGQVISYDSIEQIIQAKNLTVHVDDETYTPWISWQDDTNSSLWHQTYYEDSDSLTMKYRFVNEQGLGGVGMWSIGEYQNSEFDTLLERYFHTDITEREGSIKNPIIIETPFQDARDTTEGTSYFNAYGGACDIHQAMYGFEYVYKIEIAQKGTLDISLSMPDTTTKLSLQLLDAPQEKSCLAQNDTHISKVMNPGTYYIVVDTKVIDMVDKRGMYTLDVGFVAE